RPWGYRREIACIIAWWAAATCAQEKARPDMCRAALRIEIRIEAGSELAVAWNSRSGLIQLLQAITVAVDGSEAPPVLRREAELVADAAHMRVQRTRSHHCVWSPDGLADVAAREQPADVAQKQHREIEILGGQLDRPSFTRHGARLAIDPIHVQLDHLGLI